MLPPPQPAWAVPGNGFYMPLDGLTVSILSTPTYISPFFKGKCHRVLSPSVKGFGCRPMTEGPRNTESVAGVRKPPRKETAGRGGGGAAGAMGIWARRPRWGMVSDAIERVGGRRCRAWFARRRCGNLPRATKIDVPVEVARAHSGERRPGGSMTGENDRYFESAT